MMMMGMLCGEASKEAKNIISLDSKEVQDSTSRSTTLDPIHFITMNNKSIIDLRSEQKVVLESIWQSIHSPILTHITYKYLFR